MRLPQAPGVYYVVACADDLRRVRERSEGNNCRSTAPITVSRKRPPRVSPPPPPPPAPPAPPPPAPPAPPPAAPSLDSHPEALTSSGLSRFTFSSPRSDVSFRCSLDGSEPAWCASPATYVVFGDATHKFSVTAVDGGGKQSDATSFTWKVDQTPPPAPTIVSTPPAATRSASASFTFSDTENGVTFRCALDGASASVCTSPQAHSGLSDGTHTFSVKARDAAGNESAATTSQWVVDSTAPPAPTFVSHPTNPTNATGATFAFTNSESGVTFTCRLDGGSYAACTSPRVIPDLADGSHTFSVKAHDALGESLVSSFSWTIDTVAPTATPSIVGFPEQPSDSAVAVFAFTTTESGVSFRCSINGSAFAACTTPHSLTLADGEHRFRVRTADPAGNEGPLREYRWMIDTTAPLAAAFELGVFRGRVNAAGVAEFSTWLGRPITRTLEYLERDSWTDISSPTDIVSAWGASPYDVIYSVPMLPNGGGTTLAQGAQGTYNPHFVGLAQTLVAHGQGDAVLRLGWEFNGSWFPWSAAGNEASFREYWRQIVTAMRGVPGASFKFEWAPVIGLGAMNADQAWPGEAYVDYIGMTVFDQDWWPGWDNPIQRWRNFMSIPFGLQWHHDFASFMHKPMTYPEFALTTRDDGHGGGDAPYYLEKMYQWFNATNVAYAIYFEQDDGDSIHRLMGPSFPNGAARFKALYAD